MTTDAYLRKIRYYDAIIINHADEYQKLMGLATNIVAPIDSEYVQGSATDRIGNMVAKMVDTDSELSKIIVARKKIVKQLEQLSDVNSYNILFRYYALDQSFMELSRTLHYSKTHISRLYHKAIEEFEQKYGSTYLKK